MKNNLRVLLAVVILLCFTACSSDTDNSDPHDPVQGDDSFKVLYAAQDVNLREGAGVENAIIKVVLRGESVKVYSTENGWSKIKYDGQLGYVNASYLSLEKPLPYEQLAQNIMKTMSEEEKVGQMFFVRCRKDTALADLKNFSLGGYILFTADIKGNTKESLKTTIQKYQNASKINLLIGVDEEGGDIVRISKYPEFRAVPFHSPQSLYAEGGFELIASDTKEKAKLLKSLGFNVNMAPVCDISIDPADYIYSRTFGKPAAETSEYVKTVVQTMNSNGIGCTLKHFPGYGNNVDTHTGIAIDSRSYETFTNSDFIPFRIGIETGAGSVLVSHNIVKCMDENLPASLSPAVHKILREELDFDGVIMTDDLKMDAIKKYIGDDVSAVLAIKAGNDLIVASDFEMQIPSVLNAIESGAIEQARIDESVLKILEWKLRLGIIS